MLQKPAAAATVRAAAAAPRRGAGAPKGAEELQGAGPDTETDSDDDLLPYELSEGEDEGGFCHSLKFNIECPN